MPSWVSNVAELVGFYTVGVLLMAGGIVLAGRYMDRNSRVSQERLRAVSEYSRDFRIYVPADWTREPRA